MAIPVWNQVTGFVGVSNFDAGVFLTMGALPAQDPDHPCYSLTVPGFLPNNTSQNIDVYFAQPEAIFKRKTYPFITVNRDDFAPAMHRWHSVGQLEYKVPVGTPIIINGVSGSTTMGSKIQAFPYDFTYTISCFNRYENTVQPILSKLLKLFPPTGKLYLIDSLGLPRTYESYMESPVVNLQELIDTVNRVRGYAITIRVEGELDLVDGPVSIDTVTGIDLNLHRIY